MSIEQNTNDKTLAAVDLGSNSFHMMVSRYQHGEFAVIDRQREPVRLASGLDENGDLTEEVATRALDCLKRFGQLLQSLEPQNVRVVGTNAMRRMNNSRQFLELAEAALGHKVEIIAGREEARLIYLGVSKWSNLGDESRLVIDIGGGSTEVIVGKGDQALSRESLEVGCVVMTQQFFADGCLSKERFYKAKMAAELAIQPVVNQFRLQGWNQVVGCSGTMKSIAGIVTSMGWSKEGLTHEALEQLYHYVLGVEHIDDLKLTGLSQDRKPVFAGGLSVILALFELFEIRHMSVSDIALREGVLYDLVGRSSAQDVRQVTVNAMLSRWSPDEEQGAKVKQTALSLYQQVNNQWDIQASIFEMVLGWAAQLHELGLLISHDGYHKHGAYVVANADMAGFGRSDQALLSVLVYGHRRKFPLDQFEGLPASLVTPAKRLAVILRLAVLLHRDRSTELPKKLTFNAEGQQVKLAFSDQWLQSHPLTAADLAQEQHWMKAIGIKLKFQ